MTILIAILTIITDIALGGSAIRIARAVEKQQKAQTDTLGVQTKILQQLTQRVEALEAKH